MFCCINNTNVVFIDNSSVVCLFVCPCLCIGDCRLFPQYLIAANILQQVRLLAFLTKLAFVPFSRFSFVFGVVEPVSSIGAGYAGLRDRILVCRCREERTQHYVVRVPLLFFLFFFAESAFFLLSDRPTSRQRRQPARCFKAATRPSFRLFVNKTERAAAPYLKCRAFVQLRITHNDFRLYCGRSLY